MYFILQSPIESGLIKSLADHLNAEIVNGTVSNVNDAIAWLTYTFLFVRMCKNPLCYGLKMDDVMNDPQLTQKRRDLIVQAAQLLDRCMMCRYDPGSGNLGVTDLGRVASHYYIKHGTIEAFNSMLAPHLSDVEALHVLCSSSEFDQLKLRPEELTEIDALKKRTPVTVKIPVEETAGKVNVLLQSYIGQNRVTSFTLISDTNYVAQNAGRITRALFEICLKRGWSTLTSHYLELCKCIDRRIRTDQTPLRQFYYDALPQDAVRRLEELKVDVNRLIDMSPREIGELCRNQKVGEKILSLVKKLPYLSMEVQVQPITRTIIRIIIDVRCDFEWSDRYHGPAECFWIWIEDGDNEYIYHSQHFILSKKQASDSHRIDITIPVRQPLPPQYYIRCVSDKWVGCTTLQAVSFKHLILPELMPSNTDLLDLHPVPVTALQNTLFQSLYTRFSHFNPIQSQVFHTLYHSDGNCLVGAPTGSGKTIMSELAILRLISAKTGGKIVYVAPLKALARERTEDWKEKLGKKLGMSIVELTGDYTPHRSVLEQADLFIVTPEKWDSISRGWQHREYVKRVELVIIDEIHLLGVERGAVLEVIVSRMRLVSEQMRRPIRFVGLSTALANARDLADWLGVPPVGMYNFRPSVRPVPMTVHILGFPTKAFCPRNATMNRPAYAAICEHSPTKPALIFVSSRRQTRLTALDLISFCAAEDNPKKFLHMSEEEAQAIADTLKDTALRDTLVFGIALHHAGLDAHDKKVVEELFLEGKIQVLVATSTLAWGVNLPCHLVIVKDTVYYDGKTKRYVDFPVTDILQMMGRAGRPQFDNSGIAVVLVFEPMKNFYRQFLFQPFPCESSLFYLLHEHFNAEIVTGVIQSVDDCLEYLSWTFFYRRLVANPSYYKLDDSTPDGIARYLTELVSNVTDELTKGLCIESSYGVFTPTNLGRITSHYYLSYKTVGLFVAGVRNIVTSLPASTDPPLLEVDPDHAPTHDLLEKCTQLLCNAYEFSEVPVRHNEDLLNAEVISMFTNVFINI